MPFEFEFTCFVNDFHFVTPVFADMTNRIFYIQQLATFLLERIPNEKGDFDLCDPASIMHMHHSWLDHAC
jgi:hypothetical protein